MSFIDHVEFFQQHRGVTMGLACAVQLANLYLSGMDTIIASVFGTRSMCYKRFVDDVLVIHDSYILADQLVDAFCSFDSLLSITFDAGDVNKISFLDLLLQIVEGELVYST